MLWGASELDEVLAWARVPPPRRVADLGCGRGLLGRLLLSRFPAARVDGFDLDEDTVASARLSAKGLRGRLTFTVADAADTDARPGYDLVVGQAILVHQSMPERILAEARKSAQETLGLRPPTGGMP